MNAAELLALSDERALELRLRLASWNDGWNACLDTLADHIGGRVMPAHPTELEERRWGPGGREHFAGPRPGDFPGGPLPVAEADVGIWLGGPPVHRHECTSTCYSYKPGRYSRPGQDGAA